MRARLTVLEARTGACADVELDAPDGTCAAGVLMALRRAVGADPGAPIAVGERRPDPDAAAIDCGLWEGTVAVVGGQPDNVVDGAALALEVASGPDAGRIIALSDGRTVIGRSMTGRSDPARAGIADPAISRAHAAITVSGSSPAVTATLMELGSANGTAVDGVAIPAGRSVDLSVGAWVDVGTSRLRVASWPRAGEGPAVLHRAPRPRRPPAPGRIEFPGPPSAPARIRVPWLATMVPLAGGVALAAALRQWQFLAFTALSPVMMLAQAASDHRDRKRAIRAANDRHAETTAAAKATLGALIEAERRRRHEAAPDLATLARVAASRGPLLWSRGMDDEDTLSLRLGCGELPSAVTVAGAAPPAVTDVPVTVRLAADGPLGVCGASAAGGLVRSLVVQAATLHAPGALRIVILAPGGAPSWAWAGWLPHTRSVMASRALVGFDDVQIAARVRELAGAADLEPDRPHTLVVVDECVARLTPAARIVLEQLGGDRTSLVWSAADPGWLPARTATVVTVSQDRCRAALRRPDGTTVADIRADLVSPDVAERIARLLAPLSDGSAPVSTSLPSSLRWADLDQVNLSDHRAAIDALRRTWARPASTQVALGRTATGPFTLDLCADGPHALIAGTTGSGKSELLLTLVAGLVARNGPDRLSLLLLDHKGGATFGRCAELPHTVGVITDLQPDSTRRALLSLTAELRRRETRLAAAGVTDYASYADTGSAAEPLTRLVIVIDEFATLAGEQPDFVDGLIGIARRGRSLGVHLVLATQRPEGVLSADIRANTRIRVCLAVAGENESRDVIDSPAAAAISATTPGRAFAKVGAAAPVELHTARVGVRSEPVGVRVALSPASALGDPPDVPMPGGGGRTDLDVLVAAAAELATELDLRTPTPPWRPPLPPVLPLASLGSAAAGDADEGDTEQVRWGLVDLPAEGQQRALTFDLGRGSNLVIAGTARSGRTTAARAIALAATGRRSPEQLHLWAVDATGDLADLALLPHCGAVLSGREHDRLELLLDHLSAAVAERRRTGRPDQPVLMLLIDSWESVCAAADRRDPGRIADRLLRLAADGPAAGLHLVTTTERAGLTGRLAAAGAERIVLRPADPSDLALVGLHSRDMPRELPPGRGYRASDLALIQVARPDDADLARAADWPRPRSGARRFDPLPDRLPLAVVQSPVGAVGLGVRAGDLAAVCLRPAELGAGFLVAGPPGAGRSSALALIAAQLPDRPVIVCAPAGSPVLDRPEVIPLPMDDPDPIARIDAATGSGRRPHLLVDDVDRLENEALRAHIERWISSAADPEQVIVLAGITEAMAVAFRGPVAQARRRRCGLLLCPMGPHDADLFGARLPPASGGDDPPGRGWLLQRGRAVGLQLAALDPRPDQPAAGTRTSAARACSAE
ncbi:MAG TPA: FtsK/SpoIIIE domain-containing protein [Mycobacteriales bacterium]|nr:FtsK/SpoIIIE domain-containing protein [Mycobacteriales bacterium]